MPYDPGAINLDRKFEKFSKHWSPRIVAQLNDLHVKAAKVQALSSGTGTRTPMSCSSSTKAR